MAGYLIAACQRAARVVIDVLDALFPGPPDDVMDVAEAVGVTTEPEAVVDADEVSPAEYHATVCKLVQENAETRRAVKMFDFQDWERELAEDGAR